MKGILFLLTLTLAICGYSQEGLHKTAYGKYVGKMPAYTIVKDEIEMEIAEHEIFLTIDQEKVIYNSGNIELGGEYTVRKGDKGDYHILATITNGKSLSYDMDFVWNKKSRSIFVAGSNGQPDVSLEIHED